MKKERRLGNKNKYGIDKPMFIKTDGWEIITNKDVLEIIDAILNNEENIYPRDSKFLGCEFFLGELNLILKKYDYELIKKRVHTWM